MKSKLFCQWARDDCSLQEAKQRSSPGLGTKPPRQRTNRLGAIQFQCAQHLRRRNWSAHKPETVKLSEAS